MTTATKTKDLKKEQQQKDKVRADELMQAYADLLAEQESQENALKEKLRPFQEEFDKQANPIKALYQGRLSPVKDSLEAAKKELLEIGDRNKKVFFGVDGNWNFENGFYLHIKKITTPVFGEAFDLSKFVKKFQDYVSVTFKIKELKSLYLDGDSKVRKSMMDAGFDLDVDEEIEIKESKKPKAKEEPKK